MAKPKKETKPNTPADNHYIKINGKKIEDYVIEKAEEKILCLLSFCYVVIILNHYCFVWLYIVKLAVNFHG